MAENDYRIFLKKDSPWDEILSFFPKGFPVQHPFPIGKGKGRADKPILLWSIPLDRLTSAEADAIAQTIAKKYSVSPTEVFKEAKKDGYLAEIAHHWVERLEGDTEDYSIEDREILGRNFRVFYALGKCPPIPFRLDLQLAVIFLEALRAALKCPWNKGEGAQTITEMQEELVSYILPSLLEFKDFIDRDWKSTEDISPEIIKSCLKKAAGLNTLIDFDLSATAAYHLVGQMQLLLRNPEFRPHDVSREIAIELQKRIVELCPEALPLLEMGWHPEFDKEIDRAKN